eukprot:CAMPEP_0183562700 /NCGR_PEP_ID=MMETSP0371-20130417/98654_1 /TAXON_ID=268820 /ORGANISM="Peridinium aciculiferum, Strain PAER-2" /LENGTH=54 /DNA_ID=CAMNT_0025771433 /DNA_START=80 /DNA_END=241 /DNA_ORIENTATION=-
MASGTMPAFEGTQVRRTNYRNKKSSNFLELIGQLTKEFENMQAQSGRGLHGGGV